MKSFKNYLVLLLCLGVASIIGYIIGSEILIFIIGVVSFMSFIGILIESNAEIQIMEKNRIRFEKLIMFLQTQGLEIPYDIILNGQIELINIEVKVDYLNELSNEHVNEIIYANVSKEIDLYDLILIKKLIDSNREIYNLPEKYSIVSIKRH